MARLGRCPSGPDGTFCVMTSRRVGVEPIGHVQRVYLESHIRRGRLQTEPWWRAVDGEGHELVLVARRRDALAAVIAAAEGR